MCQAATYFYPRPPRGGRPDRRGEMLTGLYNFYPRPPRGGRPCPWPPAPRQADFYPRPPRGGRRGNHYKLAAYLIFLSTPSARRATRSSGRKWPRPSYFYPRPPRGGRPPLPPGPAAEHRDFYPRPPRGGRPRKQFLVWQHRGISIHALREEGDIVKLSPWPAWSS